MQSAYLEILKEELVGAMGCTEPISLAYAGARLRDVMGGAPDKVVAFCSGNMLKNVRCVIIPNSGNLMGIETAVLLGIAGGDAVAGMEVLKNVSDTARDSMRQWLGEGRCKVEYLESAIPLHIVLEGVKGQDTARLEIRYTHLNVVHVVKNGEVLLDNRAAAPEECGTDRSVLSMAGILEFSNEVPISLVKDMLERQIRCNMDIAYEGMAGNYGLGLGRVIKESYPESVDTRMKAYAAAASEARMGGCEMAVITNSGSGNQGIAASIPVIVYAREKNIGREKLYRALLLSNLTTIYQRDFIGRLSAFCGAVSACCASGAAITYLCGGTLEQIEDTIDNTLANIPGIICDGAKVSCAAKIATSFDAAMMAHYMAMQGKAYGPYTGILRGDAGQTISSVGYIGRVGMQQTDKEIINLLITK